MSNLSGARVTESSMRHQPQVGRLDALLLERTDIEEPTFCKRAVTTPLLTDIGLHRKACIHALAHCIKIEAHCLLATALGIDGIAAETHLYTSAATLRLCHPPRPVEELAIQFVGRCRNDDGLDILFDQAQRLMQGLVGLAQAQACHDLSDRRSTHIVALPAGRQEVRNRAAHQNGEHVASLFQRQPRLPRWGWGENGERLTHSVRSVILQDIGKVAFIVPPPRPGIDDHDVPPFLPPFLAYSSGVGRLYAEDLIVKIEGAAGTMIVSA